MKTLIQLYNYSDWMKKLPYSSKTYPIEAMRKGYEDFAKRAKRKGIIFGRSSLKWYKGNGVFEKAWIFDKEWKKLYDIKADVVLDKTSGLLFNKKREMSEEVKFYNHPLVDNICSNKWLTYELFHDFMPKSFRAKNKIEFEAKLNFLNGEKIVVKPFYGSSGRGVRVVVKENLNIDYKKEFIQQFISVSGVPGICEGVADLRVIMCDGKVLDVYVRKAATGEISNVSKGGQIFYLGKRLTLRKVRKICKNIDSKLEHFGSRLYTLDFVFDEFGKPWLMEMNSKPAFFGYLFHNRPDLAKEFENKMLNSIKKII